MQGHLFSPPLPPDSFIELLREGEALNTSGQCFRGFSIRSEVETLIKIPPILPLPRREILSLVKRDEEIFINIITHFGLKTIIPGLLEYILQTRSATFLYFLRRSMSQKNLLSFLIIITCETSSRGHEYIDVITGFQAIHRGITISCAGIYSISTFGLIPGRRNLPSSVRSIFRTLFVAWATISCDVLINPYCFRSIGKEMISL
jgi:hypothetical protein